jgi:hypothetical protein
MGGMNDVVALIYDDIHILTRNRKYKRSIEEHGQPRFIIFIPMEDMISARYHLINNKKCYNMNCIEDRHRENMKQILFEDMLDYKRTFYDYDNDHYKTNPIFEQSFKRHYDNEFIEYPNPKPYYSNFYSGSEYSDDDS